MVGSKCSAASMAAFLSDLIRSDIWEIMGVRESLVEELEVSKSRDLNVVATRSTFEEAVTVLCWRVASKILGSLSE